MNAGAQGSMKGCLRKAYEFISGSADFRLKKIPLAEFNTYHLSQQPYRDSPHPKISYAPPTAEFENLSINETITLNTWHYGLKRGKLLGYATDSRAVFLQDGDGVFKLPLYEIQRIDQTSHLPNSIEIAPQRKSGADQQVALQKLLKTAKETDSKSVAIQEALILIRNETEPRVQLEFLANTKHLATSDFESQVAHLVVRNLFHENADVRSEAQRVLGVLKKQIADPRLKAEIEIQTKVAKYIERMRSGEWAERACEKGATAAVLGALAVSFWDGGAVVFGALGAVAGASAFSSSICWKVGAKFAARGLKKTLRETEQTLTRSERARVLSQTRDYLFQLETEQSKQVEVALADVKEEESRLLNALTSLLLEEDGEGRKTAVQSLNDQKEKLDLIRRELTELSEAPQAEIRLLARTILKTLNRSNELSSGNR